MGDDRTEVLRGGVGNAGAVVRVGGHVLRPTNPHTATIHALLAHVRAAGFDGVPVVVGLERDGRERLAFIAGDVPVPPFPLWSQTDQVLASTARLLRRFHDATIGFVPPVGATWSSELADPSPRSELVVCHNDVCPENVVYRDGVAVALLDFDFAAPGRRVHDVASTARMCIPMETNQDAVRTGRGGLDSFQRLRIVADAYGLDRQQRVDLLEALAGQIEQGEEFVQHRIEAGEKAFVEMWCLLGGQPRLDRRREWFAENRPAFTTCLLEGLPPC